MKRFYVAGPLFSDAQRDYLEALVSRLAKRLRLDPVENFFLPHRDAGDVGENHSQDAVFEADLEHVRAAEAVIAWLDGSDVDSGTAIEMGIAYERGRPIFGLLTDFRYWHADTFRAKINNMAWGLCDNGKNIARSIGELEQQLDRYLNRED